MTLFPDMQTMLDNISIYWFSGTAASSLRIYKESMSTGDRQTLAKGYCQVTRQHLHAVQHSLLVTRLLSGRQGISQHLLPAWSWSAAGMGSQLLAHMCYRSVLHRRCQQALHSFQGRSTSHWRPGQSTTTISNAGVSMMRVDILQPGRNQSCWQLM